MNRDCFTARKAAGNNNAVIALQALRPLIFSVALELVLAERLLTIFGAAPTLGVQPDR